MLAQATIDFRDLKEGVFRKAGETFEVTEERFKALSNSRYGRLVKKPAKPRVRRTETPEE